ncbi:MAG TPA: hypothetical protein DCP08_00610 [Chloroflexi bacterium]|nr:hypothetical protein [Chloroflexota bacterium]
MAASLKDSPELLNSLQQELQAKSLMLAELELIIEDYEGERSKLLKELTALKERILDLAEGKEPQRKRE